MLLFPTAPDGKWRLTLTKHGRVSVSPPLLFFQFPSRLAFNTCNVFNQWKRRVELTKQSFFFSFSPWHKLMSTQMHRRALKLHQPSTNRLLRGQSFYKKGSGSEFPLVRPTSPLTVSTLGSCFPHKKHFSEHWEEKMNHNYEPRTLRTLVFYSTKSLMIPQRKINHVCIY